MTFHRHLLPDPASYFESEGLTLTGPHSAKWKTTRCEFHGGSDSMRINTAAGWWCCMACGVKGGDVLAYHMQAHNLEFVEAAQQLGAWLDDGAPARQTKPAALPARAALQVLAFEANLAAVAAANVANGIRLSVVDRARLLTAAGRINRLAEDYE
jgi:hypothetical protein